MIIAFWALFLIVLGSIVWGSIRSGISPMPTLPKVKLHLLESIPNDIEGTILELGAGWGTLAFPLAERYRHCTIIAYETSWIPYLFCTLRQWIRPRLNIRIVHQDFFEVPLGDASLLVCYLYRGAMQRLSEKLIQELKPGALVVSHTFSIPGWSPESILVVDDLYRTPIYQYRKG